jgi:hypothetical protein
MFASIKLSSKQIVETGIVFAVICLILGLRTDVRFYYFAAIAWLLLALLVPALLKPLAVAWFGLSKILGWFSSRLLLSIIFYLLVTPVALLRKLLGKDRLQLNSFKKEKASAFVKRNRVFSVADLEKTY